MTEAPDSASAPQSNEPSARRGGRRRAARPAVRSGGSQTRNIMIFAVLIGGLAVAFGLLGSTRRSSGGTSSQKAPDWKIGQSVEVEITIVTTDHKNLSCAMKAPLAGRHCAFESQNKRRTAGGDSRANDKLLQPYTTAGTKTHHLLASGLWMQPELKTKLDKEDWALPSPRFTVKCQFKIEGRAKAASVQWKPGDSWGNGNGWFTGNLSDCHIQAKPTRKAKASAPKH